EVPLAYGVDEQARRELADQVEAPAPERDEGRDRHEPERALRRAEQGDEADGREHGAERERALRPPALRDDAEGGEAGERRSTHGRIARRRELRGVAEAHEVGNDVEVDAE